MIVPVTSEKYDDLFAQASEFLGLTGDDVIDSINSYYGHMKTFYEEKAYKYIMMPLDDAQGEEAFNIDLNSRAITIPSNFLKTGGVQSDQMAELIVFKVDRFFDYMDLANTYIYVQWQLPNAEKTVGVTKIEIVDLDGEPGKIRFAWPLTQTITQHSGVVKFSVRFYVFNGQHELTYSLNTLEASLNIKPALDPTHNPGNFDKKSELFELAILNSRFTDIGTPPPKVPDFGFPGLDMYIVPQYIETSIDNKEAFDADKENKYYDKGNGVFESIAQYDDEITKYYHKEDGFVRHMTESNNPKAIQVAKLSSNNKLLLRAQAVITDAGKLKYQWKFQEDKPLAPWTDIPGAVITDPKDLTYLPATFAVNKDGELVPSFKDAYYIQNADGSHSRYDMSNKGIPTGKDGKYDNSLYEGYAEYEVPSTGDVVGTYALVATNTVSNVTSDPAWSTYCYLPGPKDIEFEKNPYTVEKDKISANIVKDINEPNMSYAWFYSAENSETVVNLAKNAAIDTEGNVDFDNGILPGWYCVQARADLNRKKKNNSVPTSQIIYAAPAIESVKPAVSNPAYNIAGGQTQPLELQISVKVPQVFADNGIDNVAEELYKNLSFEWFYRRSDSNTWKPITKSMIGDDKSKLVSAFDEKTGTLTVRNIEDKVAYQYKCTVTNTLGSESAQATLSDEDLFLIY